MKCIPENDLHTEECIKSMNPCGAYEKAARIADRLDDAALAATWEALRHNEDDGNGYNGVTFTAWSEIVYSEIDRRKRGIKGQESGTPTGETIDITPRGCMTVEGRERVRKARHEWDDATYELANTIKRVIDKVFDRDTDKIAKAEYYSELQTLIGIREVKQEAFLRAVAGR